MSLRSVPGRLGSEPLPNIILARFEKTPRRLRPRSFRPEIEGLGWLVRVSHLIRG